jgi:hypothetical protein
MRHEARYEHVSPHTIGNSHPLDWLVVLPRRRAVERTAAPEVSLQCKPACKPEVTSNGLTEKGGRYHRAQSTVCRVPTYLTAFTSTSEVRVGTHPCFGIHMHRIRTSIALAPCLSIYHGQYCRCRRNIQRIFSIFLYTDFSRPFRPPIVSPVLYKYRYPVSNFLYVF